LSQNLLWLYCSPQTSHPTEQERYFQIIQAMDLVHQTDSYSCWNQSLHHQTRWMELVLLNRIHQILCFVEIAQRLVFEFAVRMH
jgi:hypothetical protein